MSDEDGSGWETIKSDLVSVLIHDMGWWVTIRAGAAVGTRLRNALKAKENSATEEYLDLRSWVASTVVFLLSRKLAAEGSCTTRLGAIVVWVAGESAVAQE